MKKILFTLFLLLLNSTNNQAQSKSSKPGPSYYVRHTVVLRLKYSKGSAEEKEFLVAVAKLSAIPGVHKFESLHQTSSKNDFDYRLSIEYDAKSAYDVNLYHPFHGKFVETYWVK